MRLNFHQPSPDALHGTQSGPLRPDWGDQWAELTCTTCGAGWVGPIGEQCAWCDLALERQRQWQAELVLRPPEVDQDDEHYQARMTAWRGRLRRAVEAGLIDERQAHHAFLRAQGERAA